MILSLIIFINKCLLDCKSIDTSSTLINSEVAKRNYELEELLYSQASKMKPAKENLLKLTDDEVSKGF